MFEDKKAADAHDKMLELAEQFTALLESQIEGIDEIKAESFGLLLSRNKDLVIQACKGKPEVLDGLVNGELNDQEEAQKSSGNDASVVTAITEAAS